MTRVFLDFHNPLSKRDLIILGASTLIAGSIYLLTSYFFFGVGFPLDESWVHLTFARNLAQHGEWSFRPGIPSAGSTSPLWSALLAIGFLFNLTPYVWTYFLGLSIMWALSVISEVTARRLVKTYITVIPWVGLFIIVEWHFLWAAMSGMETLLHALIATVILSALMLNSRRYLTLGFLTGLSIWVRPDGLTLLGPLVLAVLFTEKDSQSRMRGVLQVGLGFGALFLFYLLFNLLIGGAPMPNTFYARQAEYAALQRPLVGRLGELFLKLLVGPSFLLLPGIVMWMVRSIRERSWGSVLALIWSIGYMGLYVFRLPLDQHERYIIPALPIFFLIGFLAIISFTSGKTFGRYQWFMSMLWKASLGIVTLLFIVLGARAYAEEVALTEQEMVTVAKWSALNLPPEAVLAAHDTGALGYFDQHPLIDLAGLASPDVIPFIRDEAQLAAYLDGKNVAYLIVYPDLYEKLPLGREVVYVTGGTIATKEGYPRMTIYRWK
ncbi:MAG: hypothetical protein IPP55_21730 [Anaerolineales bacterium]|nr:hypothetical protein [Anaerolineales bacterium]